MRFLEDVRVVRFPQVLVGQEHEMQTVSRALFSELNALASGPGSCVCSGGWTITCVELMLGPDS